MFSWSTRGFGPQDNRRTQFLQLNAESLRIAVLWTYSRLFVENSDQERVLACRGTLKTGPKKLGVDILTGKNWHCRVLLAAVAAARQEVSEGAAASCRFVRSNLKNLCGYNAMHELR